jgi:hypothetical protein
MWHRVFCRSPDPVSPAMLAEHLHSLGLTFEPHFRGDDLGWTVGELRLPGGGAPLVLHRYLTAEDDLRDDLNAFAAELETMDHHPNHVRLMEHVVQTRQLVTFRRPIDHADEAALDRLCEAVGRFLAVRCDGLIQIDGQGWFAADGTSLLPEF